MKKLLLPFKVLVRNLLVTRTKHFFKSVYNSFSNNIKNAAGRLRSCPHAVLERTAIHMEYQMVLNILDAVRTRGI